MTQTFRHSSAASSPKAAHLVEVLPREEYEEKEHLSGAIHIPLKVLDQGQPPGSGETGIVYCHCYL